MSTWANSQPAKPEGSCEWFARCKRPAELLVEHPAFPAGVPTCGTCAQGLGLTGTPLPPTR